MLSKPGRANDTGINSMRFMKVVTTGTYRANGQDSSSIGMPSNWHLGDQSSNPMWTPLICDGIFSMSLKIPLSIALQVATYQLIQPSKPDENSCAILVLAQMFKPGPVTSPIPPQRQAFLCL